MRDILLMGIVGILSIVGLFRPSIGVLGYTWFAVMRPDILAFAEGRPYSAILAATTLVGSARATINIFRLLRLRLVWVFLVFQVQLGLSVLFAGDTSLCFPAYKFFLLASLMALLIPLVLQGEREFRWLYIVCTLSVALLGAKYGLYGLVAGGTVFSQGYGGALNDNNMLALALSVGVPMSWHMRSLRSGKVWKLFCAGLVATSCAAVMMTHSRGGILTLASVFPLLAYRSKHRTLVVIVLMLLVLPGAGLVWSSMSERLATVATYQEDNSAMGRLTMWQAALKMSIAHPLLGVGFGGENWRAEAPKYLPPNYAGTVLFVHNNYLQLLADSGYPALLLLLGMLLGSLRWLGKTVKRFKETQPEWSECAAGLQVGLIAFMVGSTFLSRVSYDFIYILLMVVATFMAMVKDWEAGRLGEGVKSVERVEQAEAVLEAAPATPEWARPGAGRKLRRREPLD